MAQAVEIPDIHDLASIHLSARDRPLGVIWPLLQPQKPKSRSEVFRAWCLLVKVAVIEAPAWTAGLSLGKYWIVRVACSPLSKAI